MSRREPISRTGSGTPHRAAVTAGVSVLARLLWSGVVGGFAIGGLVAVALFARAGPDEALTVFSSGAVVGVVAGVAVQVLNAVVLHVVRRTARGLTPNALRLVLTPLPAAAAPVLPALLVSSDAGAGTTALRWLPVAMAGVLAAAAAWWSSPWCLGPITPGGGRPTP